MSGRESQNPSALCPALLEWMLGVEHPDTAAPSEEEPYLLTGSEDLDGENLFPQESMARFFDLDGRSKEGGSVEGGDR